MTGLAGEIGGFEGARRVDNLIRLGVPNLYACCLTNVTMTLPLARQL